MNDDLPMTIEDWERLHGVWGTYDDMGPRLESRYYRQYKPGFTTMHELADAAIAWLDKHLFGRAS